MSLARRYSMFNKNFICVFVINLVISLVFYLSTVAGKSFASDVLNISDSLGGLAVGLFVIGALVARLYYGSIIDNINIKKVAIISLVLYFLINACYILINHIELDKNLAFILLLIVRLAAGVFYGVCSCACGAAIARLVPSNQRGVGIGYYAISVVLASAIGPFLAIWLLKQNAFDAIFAVALASIFIAFVASLIMRVRGFKKHQHHAGEKKGFSIYNYIEKSVVGIGWVVFLAGCAYGAIVGFIGEYSKELNLMEAGAIFFVVYAVVAVFARPISGKIFDKKGAHFVIVPSIVLFIVALVLLAAANSAFMMLLAAVFVAIGYGNATSCAQSLCIKVCPANKMGLANSTFFIALDVGMGISPYFLGLIKEASNSYREVFASAAVLILLSLIFYYLLVMRKIPAK